ncbi:MAG TPA: hypothetical protein VMJ10_15885 [Kofleriaceae bacterium]|nr:hypothetical protein [Kofleriaceae bacterium]
MPTTPPTGDDLDDLLRAAMKSLDDQVPSGYLDALPEQTLARLEASMQSSGQGTSERERDAVTAPPPAAPQQAATTGTSEDSGLHDIRNLAQSTKQRLSSRRIGSGAQRASEDDIIAASSAGWKAVALPEPAQMVSLPSIDELPSKAEIRAQDKQDQAAAKAAAAVEAHAAAPASTPFARPAAPAKSRKVLAFVGVGVAAAAGLAIFIATRPNEMSEKAPTRTAMDSPAPATAGAPAPRAQITATPIAAAEPAPAPPQQVAEPKTDVASGAVAAAVPAAKPAVLHAPGRAATKRSSAKVESTLVPAPPLDTKKPVADKTKDGKEAGKQQDPSFDQLLKEAGADTKPKIEKPKLANKELSPDDFKRGMSSVEGNAKGCYKGTQGIAKLTIKVAPSGAVSSVTVGGQFAGKPEAACVQSAVRSASFPPWDGNPQSFSYPILLSE